MLHERYLRDGPACLGDSDLLALALGGGRFEAARVAADVLDAWPDLHDLARASPNALVRFPGVGPAGALRVHAALHLGLRARERAPGPPSIRSCEDAAGWLAPPLRGLRHEELHALYLDRRLRPLCRRRLTVGNDGTTIVDARQILRPAIEVGATAFVLAHNHPSGDPEPSRDDLGATRAVSAAADVVGVVLLDHLVVGGGRWVSMAQRGLLEVRPSSPVTVWYTHTAPGLPA